MNGFDIIKFIIKRIIIGVVVPFVGLVIGLVSLIALATPHFINPDMLPYWIITISDWFTKISDPKYESFHLIVILVSAFLITLMSHTLWDGLEEEEQKKIMDRINSK